MPDLKDICSVIGTLAVTTAAVLSSTYFLILPHREHDPAHIAQQFNDSGVVEAFQAGHRAGAAEVGGYAAAVLSGAAGLLTLGYLACRRRRTGEGATLLGEQAMPGGTWSATGRRR